MLNADLTRTGCEIRPVVVVAQAYPVFALPPQHFHVASFQFRPVALRWTREIDEVRQAILAQPALEAFRLGGRAVDDQAVHVAQVDQAQRACPVAEIQALLIAMTMQRLDDVRIAQEQREVAAVEPELAVDEMMDANRLAFEMKGMGGRHFLYLCVIGQLS